MSANVEISVLNAPMTDAALEQLAAVLVDCVAGGASVNFMAPFSQEQALAFFRKVAGSVASGDAVLLAAKLDGKIIGTVQLGLDTPPNQPHRADIKKMLVHRAARGSGIGAALMARVEEEARRHGRWLLVLDTVPGDNGYCWCYRYWDRRLAARSVYPRSFEGREERSAGRLLGAQRK